MLCPFASGADGDTWPLLHLNPKRSEGEILLQPCNITAGSTISSRVLVDEFRLLPLDSPGAADKELVQTEPYPTSWFPGTQPRGHKAFGRGVHTPAMSMHATIVLLSLCAIAHGVAGDAQCLAQTQEDEHIPSCCAEQQQTRHVICLQLSAFVSQRLARLC